jgi:hypothetical protein
MPRASSTTADFSSVFAALKPVLGSHATKLHVVVDNDSEYTLVSTIPFPTPPKKGERIYFGAIKLGKAYVSFHLFPLYMNPELVSTISPELKRRMQGKTCFNFRTIPEASLLKELKALTSAGFKIFRQRKWV